MEENQSAARQYNSVHTRLMMMRKELYRMGMVKDELAVQPKNTYVALGKAFVLSDYNEIQTTFTTKYDQLDKDIKKLEPMDETLAKKVTEAQEKLIKTLKEQQAAH